MRDKILVILCIPLILWFTIQPVELNWTETDLSLTVVVCGITVVAVILLFLCKQQMALSVIDTVVFLWLFYVMLRAYVTPVYPCANFCIRAIQMVSLYIAARLLFSSVTITEHVLVVGILICAGYELLLGAFQLWNGNSRHYLYALSGTFMNPGPYSVFIAIGLVMSCKLRKGYWLPAIFAMLLPATWSRAAMVSAAICIGIIYWEKWKRWKWQVAFFISVIIIGLYFVKKGSADGRSIIYMISLVTILHSPLFGYGIGSFCHQYAESMSTFSLQHPTFDFHSAGVTSNAYNILLQIGVEQGSFGLSLAIVLVALIFVKLQKQGHILSVGLLCLLFFSMFSYPFEQLPYQIIFVLIAAYSATDKEKCDISTDRYKFYPCFKPLLFLVVVSLFSIFTYNQIEKRLQAESDYQLMAGITHSAFIDDYYELFPLMNSNEHFLFDFAKILAKDGRLNDSNAMLRLGTLVSIDPMFYVIQGNNYRDMGLYQEAENAYKKSFRIMPNRLYPLYQLMLLYEQSGQEELMVQTAHRIAHFAEKVTSSATEDMKKKAIEIISNNSKSR